MKRAVLVTVLSVLSLALLPASGRAQSTQDFTVNDFTADYYLDRATNGTATLHTTEIITAEFPSYDQNHGILRAIPESYLNHTVSLQVDSVTDQTGRAWHYTTSEQNGNLVLKIGDAGTYVHGVQVYKITYDQRNVISFLSDHDEFYWDVNGDQWSQPFRRVTARLHVPAALAGRLQARRECFVGGYGTQDSARCTTDSIGSNGGEIITSQADGLAAGETMTIVNAFNKGTFKPGPEIKHEQDMKRLAIWGAAGLIIVPPLVTGWLIYRKWRAYGDDPKGRGVIVPQYEPPKGLDPLYSDFLLKEQFRSKAFSAELISLATGGNLTIYEIPKKGIFGKVDYELELNSVPADLSKQAAEGLSVIFGSNLRPGGRVKLSELRSVSLAAANAAQFQKLGEHISASLTKLGYFVKDPIKIKKSYQSWALLPFCLGFVSFFAAAKLDTVPLWGLGAGLLLAGLLVTVLAGVMRARTLAGVTAYDELLGLKDYIKLAEADRLKFLQSPQGAEKVAAAGLKPDDPKFKVKLFESLLPYAMLFDLEKDWAKQFKDIYTTPPGWYQGNWSTFNAVYLANSIGGFSAGTSVAFSPPASSGGSGFGGGGFSGGGGGGGGGGGW
jgi:uncharacterized membrane protein YgcG